jgi:flagellar motor switch protein FliN
VTRDEALTQLGVQTAEAVVGVLENFAPGAARHAAPVIAPDVATALANAPTPGLAGSVAYVNGVTGGNVFLIGLDGAHRLAATMTGGSPDAVDSTAELTELEHSAVSEAINQMIAAAAAAASAVLGYEVEIAPPELVPTVTADLVARYDDAAHVITTAFQVCDRPCRLVQLIPQTFVVRMRGALDELTVGRTGASAGDIRARGALQGQMRSTRVRLSAEVGRTKLPIQELVDVPAGTVIELDREVNDPIDIYVNGHPFAVGRLIINEADEWAVRIEQLLDADQPARKR